MFRRIIDKIKLFIDKIRSWVAVDGLLHFLCCYVITITLGLFGYLTVGIALAAVLGIFKECLDAALGADFNNIGKDLICDFVGIAIAAIIIITI